jgi:DNA-binding NtrC family response regulator
MNFSTGENSGKEGIFWMQQIKGLDPTAIVVFITAFGDIELAVKAIKQGAIDFITKPWDSVKLLNTINSALKLKQSRTDVELKKTTKSVSTTAVNTPTIVFGNSVAMLKVWDVVEKVSQTNANILLLGENGTGKDLVAREIHRLSHRCNKPYFKVDVGSLSETLFESELFGHCRGAFTDARDDRIGKIEEANGGTLFLDEIANIPIRMQTKLLTVIQNREIVRVGSNKTIPVDVRLITATNRNLKSMVLCNEFREDLLYRINTIQIEIPPLRDRIDDLPGLFNHFLNHFADMYNKPRLEVNAKIFDNLKRHSWPGNVRELEHTVEKAVILSSGNKLNLDDFVFPGQKLFVEDSLSIEANERNLIVKALDKSKGNQSKAAAELGISRKTLYNKMVKYGL